MLRLQLNDALELIILKELIPGGIPHGSNILVEFEPDSLWYETSFAIAANAVKSGRNVEYHTFVRAAKEVREQVSRLVPDLDRLIGVDSFQVLDSYTAQIGLSPLEDQAGSALQRLGSLKLANMSINLAKSMKAGEVLEGTLHIDDNASVLLQYNDEKTFVDVWRTRNLPQTRVARAVYLYALVTGTGSSSFYKQLESLSDAIIDFKSPETDSKIEHLVRVRTMRGKNYDSKWHQLQLVGNGEVRLMEST